jgi:hypothetical protein
MTNRLLLALIIQVPALWAGNLRGIELGGTASSEWLRAGLSGDSVDGEGPTGDNHAYSRADLWLNARAGAHLAGRLDVRLHQDWNKYYEEGPDPVVIRRLEISGGLFDNSLRFSAGDVLLGYSPLTLAKPEPEIPMEPEIFARRRRAAMEEWRLGEGKSPLQGISLELARRPAGWLGWTLESMAARLRQPEAGKGPAEVFQSGDADKWAAGGRARVALFSSWEAGATFIKTFDQVSSSRARLDIDGRAPAAGAPPALYEGGQVTAPFLSFNASPLLAGRPLSIKLGIEYALSRYAARRDSQGVITPVAEPKGAAWLATGHLDFGDPTDFLSLGCEGAYVSVGRDFVNDLAQSPAFVGRRILNNENQVKGRSRGYATLDALYNHVYEVRPTAGVNTLEFWGQGGDYAYQGENNWLRSAYFRNSYSPAATTQSERRAQRVALDPNVQLVFPYGLATPNRLGFKGSLKAGLAHGLLQAVVNLASLRERESEGEGPFPHARYRSLGGGLSLDLEPRFGRVLPLTLSLGYTQATRISDDTQRDSAATAAPSDSGDFRGRFQTGFLNAGISWRGPARLTLSGGYQRIDSRAGGAASERSESQWLLAADLGLGAGASCLAELGTLTSRGPGSILLYSQMVSRAELRVGF